MKARLFLWFALISIGGYSYGQMEEQLFPNTYESSDGGVIYDFGAETVQKVVFSNGKTTTYSPKYQLTSSNGTDKLILSGQLNAEYYCLFSSRFLLLFDEKGSLVEGGHFGAEIYSFGLHTVTMELSSGLVSTNPITISKIDLKKPPISSRRVISGQYLVLNAEKSSKIVSIYVSNGIDPETMSSNELTKLKTIEIYDGSSKLIGTKTLENSSKVQRVVLSLPLERVTLVFKDTYPGSLEYSIINTLIVESE